MGSTGTALSQLARHLKDNYQVEIDAITSKHLYRGEQGKLAPREDWQGIRISRVSSPPTRRDSSIARLAAGFWFSVLVFFRLLFGPRYDLVLVVTNPPALVLAARWLKKVRGTPYVYLIHDLYPDVAVGVGHVSASSAVTRAARRMQRTWLHAASKVVVLGRCMKTHLANHYGLAEQNMAVVPNWADPQHIRPIDPDLTEFRAANGLRGFVVLYAGNFGVHQCFEDILAAARLMLDRDDDVTFVFTGDGAKKSYIRETIEADGLRNARLFPFVPHEKLEDLLGSSNACLITLEKNMEGLGVPSKTYNILSAGRPIVAILSKESEVARVIEDHDCGIRVDYDNPQALADAVKRLCSEPETAARMGANARRALEECYTLEKAAAGFHEVFVEVAGGARR